MDIEEREDQEKDFDLTATVDEEDLLPEPVIEADDTEAIDVTLKDEDDDEEEVFLYPEGEEPDSL